MLKTAAVFSDNMVLQRDKNINIWGTCDCENVEVTLNGITVSAHITDGKWNAVLPPMPAGGPYTMTVTGSSDTITYKNVMLGEVWLAGGQSNMEYVLRDETHGTETLESLENDKTIRYYNVPRKGFIDDEFYAAESASHWQTAGKEESKEWSAVAVYFAKKLADKLGVTIGIIGCNWGGTSASAWMDESYLGNCRETVSYLDEYKEKTSGKTDEQMIEEYDEYCRYDAEWFKKSQKCYAENPDIGWDEVQEICGKNLWPGPMGIKNPYRPSGLYKTMLSRVAPYTLRGFLYYQGESDDHKPESYYTLLNRLISNWRHNWQDEALPFMFVQLPMFMYKDDVDRKNWCLIREAQMRVYDTVKNTGIAVITECGEYGDIHPKNKIPVGERLYLQAMHHVYNESVNAFGPIYRSHIRRENQIELIFDYADDGFDIRGEAVGFEIAGYDKEFKKANATVKGDRIFVSASDVSCPVYVRYAWTNYMEVTVFGKNRIPLAPFRTSMNDEK